METKHTPTPWKANGRYFETPSGKFHLAYGKDRHGNPEWRNFCELDENGRFIETAVNAHDELVSALKLLLGSHAPTINGLCKICHHYGSDCGANAARAALAKAGAQ